MHAIMKFFERSGFCSVSIFMKEALYEIMVHYVTHEKFGGQF